MGIEWVEHKGKKILYISYAGLSPEDQLAQINRATQELVNSGARDNLTLSDMVNAPVSSDFVERAKQQGKISGPYTKKAAVVGVDGVRKILLKAVNTVSGNPRVPFDSLEEAKDWLVK